MNTQNISCNTISMLSPEEQRLIMEHRAQQTAGKLAALDAEINECQTRLADLMKERAKFDQPAAAEVLRAFNQTEIVAFKTALKSPVRKNNNRHVNCRRTAELYGLSEASFKKYVKAVHPSLFSHTHDNK